jgi:hypothetical protein
MTSLLKLNLGCGNRGAEGFINVDKFANSGADLVVDLERTPWPWETGSVGEVRFIHSLEHMGQDTETYLGIIRETYRICADGATVVIHVPHPKHDNFTGDPTHVRAITAQQFMLFDRRLNDHWKATQSSAATPLAHYLDVDFVTTASTVVLDPLYQQKLASGELTIEAIGQIARQQNNVISEQHITLTVRKPH